MVYEKKKLSGIIKLIIIMTIVVAILIIIIILLSNKDKFLKSDNKELLLKCSDKSSVDKINFSFGIDIYKNKDEVTIVQSTYSKLNDIEINDYKEDVIKYMKNKIEGANKNILLDLEGYYDIDVKAYDNIIICNLTYHIVEEKKYNFVEVFNYNFFDSSIDDIKAYLEKGGLSCKKNY